VSKWDKVKIGGVFSLIRNGASIKQGISDGGYPITRIETIANSEVDRSKMGYAGIDNISRYSGYVLQTGDILMSHINSEKHLGKTACYVQKNDEIIIHGMNLLCLRPIKMLVNYKYANYYFKSKAFKYQIPNITKKSVNQASFTVTALKELTLPLPPLEVQKQIAKTLDTAAELLAMRKQQLAELESLTKSTFYDMFGDPTINPMGWETVVLSNCLDKIESGWSPKCQDRPVNDEEWGICKLSAVTGGYYKEQENKAIFRGTEIDLTLQVNYRDLLFSRKNTLELVGSCAYVFDTTKKLMIPDTIFRLCTKDNINKLYLWGLFNCQTFRPLIKTLATGTSGSMPNISKERLKGLEIPLPPNLRQTQFAQVVSKIEEQKSLVKKAIEETQQLFDSLMYKYF
jgi:type I restriction enzyme, S subunit